VPDGIEIFSGSVDHSPSGNSHRERHVLPWRAKFASANIGLNSAAEGEMEAAGAAGDLLQGRKLTLAHAGTDREVPWISPCQRTIRDYGNLDQGFGEPLGIWGKIKFGSEVVCSSLTHSQTCSTTRGIAAATAGESSSPNSKVCADTVMMMALGL
jgi:hypothetical protein